MENGKNIGQQDGKINWNERLASRKKEIDESDPLLNVAKFREAKRIIAEENGIR